jgi:hypothetical protein
VLFIPYGILFIGIPAVSAQPWWAKILLAGGSAGLLSFTLEVGQLWLPRTPSVVDVVCNTTGALPGAIGGIATYRHLLRRVEQVSQALRLRSTSTVLLGGYGLALSLVLALPMPLWADFINWNAKLHLLVGNEGTLDRPWLGEIYLVAIYNRALNDEEVYTNFAAGPSLSGIPDRVARGLLYYMTSPKVKGIVYTIVRAPMILSIFAFTIPTMFGGYLPMASLSRKKRSLPLRAPHANCPQGDSRLIVS